MDNRRLPLMDSCLRTGEELGQAWEKLQRHGARMVDYLGEEELEWTLGKPVEGIGEASTSGATRMGIVSQLAGLKLKVMVKSLEQEEEREARPVWSWPNRDKMTTCRLLVLPGSYTSLTTSIFQEGLTMVLCLPSLACRDRAGEMIGRLLAGGWTSLGTHSRERHWQEMAGLSAMTAANWS